MDEEDRLPADPATALRELQEVLHDLNQVKACPGLKRLWALLDQQITSRQSLICLKPLATMDEALGQEFAKGEVQGITLARHFLDGLIESTAEEVKELNKEIEDARRKQQPRDGIGSNDE